MTRVVYTPFERIEGDIRVELRVEGGAVAEARVAGTSFRGFEQILRGRDPRDAMVITPRVCGQCSLSHLAAASAALASLTGVRMPRNGLLATAVMMGGEAMLNHITHFYLSFAPQMGGVAADRVDLERFQPTTGASFLAALEARRELTPLLGLFLGKWPASLAIQPGGTTRPLDAGDLVRAAGVALAFREFLETRFLGDAVSSWLMVRSEADLLAWLRHPSHAGSDFGVFLRAALDHGLDGVGRGPQAFIAADAYHTQRDAPWFKGGCFDGQLAPLSTDQITEHVRYSWFEPVDGGVHPSVGRTIPEPAAEGAYSWTKAPRYKGLPAEVGPIARMLVDSDPLVSDLVAKRGAGVLVRALARLHEMLRIADAVPRWIDAIQPGEPFLAPTGIPEAGEGAGVVEAPRGMLGHWLSVRQGRIRNYQIVTPSAWNFSPRDTDGTPGPVESSLVGATHAVAGVQSEAGLVVKSFDPCLFCAVH